MDDNKILDLYFDRSEQAIMETDQKYGSFPILNRTDCSRIGINQFSDLFLCQIHFIPGILYCSCQRA